MQTIADWPNELGLSQYAELFARNERLGILGEADALRADIGAPG